MMQWIKNRNIILASGSPRRAELLTQAGFQFKVRTSEVSEDFPADMEHAQVAEYLAIKKANAQLSLIWDKNEVVITADSVVILGDKLLEKPHDKNEAKEMLSTLSGNQHHVITGVCLLSLEKKQSFSVRSDVYMEVLSAEEMDYYISNYIPFDKAGSYGIQEWIGLTRISRIEGSYTNIMGLPVQALYEAIKQF